MKTRTRPKRAGGAVVGVALVFAACHDDVSHRYGPVADAAAMVTIASAWAEPGGLSLTLCEDAARAQAAAADGCQVDHVVRGGGAGVEQQASHGGGCGAGGCPYGNVAYVAGTAEGAGLPAGTAVSGVVRLGSTHDDDPYALPYVVELTCDDPGAPCAVNATIAGDGRLDATLFGGPLAPGVPSTRHALDRTAAAGCP